MLKVSEKERFIHGSIFLFANKLQALGDKVTGKITTKQWFFIMIVSRMQNPAPSFTEIAKEIGTSRQNITQFLASLEALGFIEVMASPQDKRAQCVKVTPEGKLFLSEIEVVGGIFLEQLFEGVALKDLDAAVRVFKQFFINIEKIENSIGEIGNEKRI